MNRWVVGALVLSIVCCGGGGGGKSSSPVAPSPIPACEANNTAEAVFENRSISNTTYDVIWDGSRLLTLVPGERSRQYTVSATRHTLVFKIANTDSEACNESTPSPPQCSNWLAWCSY